MKNLSIHNESLELEPNSLYIVIDALYLNRIKSKLNNIDLTSLIGDLRKKIFPYTDTPFAEHVAKQRLFEINRIKRIKYEEVTPDNPAFLSSDTGLLLFINKNKLVDITKLYDYNSLVDSYDELINTNYWESLSNKFELTDIGLIASIGSENEIQGGGVFKID